MNNRKTFGTLVAYSLLALIIIIGGCSPDSTTISEDEIAEKVKEILSNMSLDDKMGEMTMVSLDLVSAGDPYNLEEPHRLDTAKLRDIIVNKRVGSILNNGGHAQTREHWIDIINAIQDLAINKKPSGIPVLYGIDAIHGANYTSGSTLYPQQIGLAATFNPELVGQLATVSAYETRASGIPWTFSPILDIGRDPRWSRFWETFGEDPMLVSIMGKTVIEAYEGSDVSAPHRVASCMKHFLGYSLPRTGKDRTPAYITERQMREYVIPPFAAGIAASASTVMICSGEIDGIPVHSSPELLHDLLRDELGFEGVVVSDWEDIHYLVSRHRVAKDYKEAIKLAVNAGVDMSMTPLDVEFPQLLKKLVLEGQVSEDRIDEAVSRILRLKIELGLFENYGARLEDYPGFASEEHTALARQGARESITLLKNENGILPLSDDRNIFITGPTANSLNALNGSWTRTWQGLDETYNTPGKLSILEAFRQRWGENNISYRQGCTPDEPVNIAEAVAKAKLADVAVVCLGELPYTEKPGDLDDLNLPTAQIELCRAVAETGTPVILLLVEGRPRIVREVETLASAVVLAYLPGDEGGPALADVVSGDYNPNGKLPFTYPRYANDLLTYDHKGTEQISRTFAYDAFNPQWEFGHGLSYTEFRYSGLNLSENEISLKDSLTITVSLENTGNMTGMETVLLFISDKISSVTPPVKRLKRFQKVSLEAGESKLISFTISPANLCFVGHDMNWVVEDGEFEVIVDTQTKTFSLTR